MRKKDYALEYFNLKKECLGEIKRMLSTFGTVELDTTNPLQVTTDRGETVIEKLVMEDDKVVLYDETGKGYFVCNLLGFISLTEVYNRLYDYYHEEVEIDNYIDELYDMCIDKDVDEIDEVFSDTIEIKTYCLDEESIKDGIGDDDCEDSYVMLRRYSVTYKKEKFTVRLYYGDNTRTVEHCEVTLD